MNQPGSGRSLAERLALMVITDSSATLGVVEAVRASLTGGATAVQVRWKGGSARELVELARTLAEPTRDAGALLLVNDRVDVALAAGADGAHLGDDDFPLAAARRIVPAGFLLGRSVDTPDEARAAERGGADYVGYGPIFPTPSKTDTGPVVGVAGVTRVRATVSLPLVAIGGIRPGDVGDVIRAGADGVAVLGAVMASSDPRRIVEGMAAEIADARGVRE